MLPLTHLVADRRTLGSDLSMSKGKGKRRRRKQRKRRMRMKRRRKRRMKKGVLLKYPSTYYQPFPCSAIHFDEHPQLSVTAHAHERFLVLVLVLAFALMC